jgi:hypothetical protein
LRKSYGYFYVIEEALGDHLIGKIFDKVPTKKKEFRIPHRKIEIALSKLSDEEHSSLDMDLRLRMIDYWNKNLEGTLENLRSSQGLKVFYFRPDLFRAPFIFESINKLCMYADKILMPDPITYAQVIPTAKGYGLTRCFLHPDIVYLNILREWIDDDLLEFLPQPELWNSEIRSRIREVIAGDTEQLVSEVKPVAVVRRSGKVVDLKPPFDSETQLSNRITAARLATNIAHPLFVSSATNSVATTDWGEDYHYWLWKLERDRCQLGREGKLLYALNRCQLNWLRGVEPHAMLEIRKSGALSETRTLLRDTFREIQDATEEEFDEVVSVCKDKLEAQITRHGKEWNDVKSKLVQKIGLKSISATVTGLVSAAASSQLSIPSFLGALVCGGIALTKGLEDVSEFMNERRVLKRNPIHIFFESKKGLGEMGKLDESDGKVSMSLFESPSDHPDWRTLIKSYASSTE